MDLLDHDVFGSDEQRAMQRRAWHLWTLLGHLRDVNCYGRSVGLTGNTMDCLDRQISLARIQGVAPAECVPPEMAETRIAALTAAGLGIDLNNRWCGGTDAIEACRAHLAHARLPDDLTVTEIDTTTPHKEIVRLDTFAQASGVLLPIRPFLCGEAMPAVCLVATDKDGEIVGCTSAIGIYSADSPMGHTFFWGMLATDPARRGQGIAMTLGAMSLTKMVDRHGLRVARTGVRPGNTASEKLCTKLGLRQSEVIVTAIDPSVFAADRITK
ncbi:GNAT family N-acetyltransferase [Pseudooceanicola sp.]|uniref:GNAT family N-acetyltransferase n=2 Tax=Pseudooceanicola sp. TaxID=1914328 RepID=UPI0035C75E11